MEEKQLQNELQAIIKRNDFAFRKNLLAYALALEKRMHK